MKEKKCGECGQQYKPIGYKDVKDQLATIPNSKTPRKMSEDELMLYLGRHVNANRDHVLLEIDIVKHLLKHIMALRFIVEDESACRYTDLLESSVEAKNILVKEIDIKKYED